MDLRPVHGHCDSCDRCAQDDGARGSRSRARAARQLDQAGWTTAGQKVGCPDHPVSTRR
ncbi:hypothetical protein ACN28G_19770 [Micromonospora sp. WMMA1923]|uniref:hypothetical protein n=1 Tax=Micromonospora sp. WMMA1923 TaxID=3404125 RepID=UPI003B928EA3